MSEPNGGLLCRTSPFLGVFLNDRSRAFNTRYWCTFSINHKSTIDIGRYRYIGNGRCGAWRYRVQPKNQKIAKVWVRILPQLAISEIPSWRYSNKYRDKWCSYSEHLQHDLYKNVHATHTLSNAYLLRLEERSPSLCLFLWKQVLTRASTMCFIFELWTQSVFLFAHRIIQSRWNICTRTMAK